jgi:hypothetical protein
MKAQRLQAGIDFGQKRADLCLMKADGQVLEMHKGFANSLSGYQQAKQYLLAALQADELEGLDVSGEATSYYWMPFFWQMYNDPDLRQHDLSLFLLNACQVRWYKKCFAPDDKTDGKDPYYIADRMRTHRPAYTWEPQAGWLALRFYTRLRFHLSQTLVREKNYFSAYLFLKYSAYSLTKPFSNTFGVTSSLILSASTDLAELAALPLEELALRLHELSGHHLPDPDENARRLRRMAAESFPLDPNLSSVVQSILDLTLSNIRFLEEQIHQVESWIVAEVNVHHPEVWHLANIRGVGLVFAAGIVAEIGDLQRFFAGQKWDKQHKRFRPKNLRDVEDAVAKFAGLWWPRSASGDFEAEDRPMSKKGNRYLRYYLVEAADGLRQYVLEYAQFYTRKYQEVPKHQHKRALVLTARKSVGLFVGLLHRNEAYRPKET